MSLTYRDLTTGIRVAGFTAGVVYLNGTGLTGTGQRMGGRFVHERSGLTLDLIEIQTVPQCFVTVHTFPVSNMGEPHTQEHLLLGKGNVGRALAVRETMSMVESTAFTQQLKTCYPFAANAGVEAFFEHLERAGYALLHPDYTDEEIRREVRHFGVKPSSGGGLELEEKGTIYTEMISSSSQPGYKAYRAMGRMLLGRRHPMSYDSGGDPKYIREMLPEDIRRFHAANYHLANMEIIASLPKGLGLEDALARFDRVLTRLQGDSPVRKPSRWSDLPQPEPAPEGSVEIVGFPSMNAEQPGPAQIAWPLTERFGLFEEGLADLFAQAFGGDPSTNLYKLFIDSKTRKMDLGARAVALGFDNEAYAHFYVYVPDLAAAKAMPECLAEITKLVKEELARVAAFADGSAELREFHERMQANLLRMKRSADKLTSSPPGFGGRMNQTIWPGLLRDLNFEDGFEKTLVQPDLYAQLEAVLAGDRNIWRDKIADWKLISGTPYAVAAKATPEIIAREQGEYAERIQAEVARLKEQYGVAGEQEAIARYQAEYDAATDELERVKSMDAPTRFIDTPPMTLDDQLDWVQGSVCGSVPLITGKFDGMNSATIGLALSVTELRGRELIFAAALPALLSTVGMTKDGDTLSHEDVIQRMRREILGVSAAYASNPATGRAELVVTGAGNTLEEARTAIDWMRAMLEAPRWSVENLSRLRDVIDQSINALRGTMQRSEEHWVQGPAMCWTYQDDPLYVSIASFHAQLLHLQRLKWMLSETSDDNDLDYIASDLPEASRAADLAYLTGVKRKDLAMPVAEALAELDAVRRVVLKKANARRHLTASPENAEALGGEIAGLVTGLSDAAVRNERMLDARSIARRVTERIGAKSEPQYVGLVAPNMTGGVHLHSVRGVSVHDSGEEAALKYLAYRLFAGGGPHGIFMKTWAAGLAYSNGLRSSAFEGRNHYYAERTPELPQTLKFVVEQLKSAPHDQPLAEYALAQVFAGTRAGSSFESRTSAMAADLADGLGPDVVEAFRRRILKLREKADLDAQLYARVDALYAEVLPGYNGKVEPNVHSTYYVIGPEKQIASWEQYLGEPVCRLYGRDYWVMTP